MPTTCRMNVKHAKFCERETIMFVRNRGGMVQIGNKIYITKEVNVLCVNVCNSKLLFNARVHHHSYIRCLVLQTIHQNSYEHSKHLQYHERLRNAEFTIQSEWSLLLSAPCRNIWLFKLLIRIAFCSKLDIRFNTEISNFLCHHVVDVGKFTSE